MKIFTVALFARVAAQVTAKQAFNNDDLKLEVNKYCTNPDSIDEGKYGIINEWDVSQVTSMKALFRDFSSCNPPIQDWNVTNVQNFEKMFSVAQSFNQDISQWDVSRGTTFEYMFYIAQSFNQDISQWDVSQGTNFENMFKGAISFDQDLSQWPQEARDSCINGARCQPQPTSQPSAKPSSSPTKISGVTMIIVIAGCVFTSIVFVL